MHQFTIPALSCGRCVAAITRAVEAADADAELEFDLGARAVTIRSSLSEAALVALLDQAGYAPAPAAPRASCCSTQAASSARSGCCCG